MSCLPARRLEPAGVYLEPAAPVPPLYSPARRHPQLPTMCRVVRNAATSGYLLRAKPSYPRAHKVPLRTVENRACVWAGRRLSSRCAKKGVGGLLDFNCSHSIKLLHHVAPASKARGTPRKPPAGLTQRFRGKVFERATEIKPVLKRRDPQRTCLRG
jgi:hypothetical protein